MLEIEEIYDARSLYFCTIEREKKASKKLADYRLDQQIAERNGDTAAAEEANAHHKEFVNTEWYPAYRSKKEAARALCAALGLDADQLRNDLL